MTYIYAYTKDNKAYVGKTINPNDRKSAHRKRFAGWDYQIIDSIDSFDKSQWKPLESCWITAYEEGGYEMENKNKGGNGPEGWRTEGQIAKYMEQYFSDNKEKLLKQHQQYFLDNKETKSKKMKQWYLANKERIKEKQRQYDQLKKLNN